MTNELNEDVSEIFDSLVEENEEGDLVLTETGEALQVMMQEAAQSRVDEAVENLIEAFDDYMAEEVDSDLDDIRDLVTLAVTMVGGEEARDKFLKRVAALARANALSATTGDWAQGVSGHNASRNRDSIRAGGQGRPVNMSDSYEAEVAAGVFAEAAEGLSEAEVEQLKEQCGHLEFDSRTMTADQLRDQIVRIRDGGPAVARYAAAISKLTPK